MNNKKPKYQRVDVFSLKGGVGKTTLAVLLANQLAAPPKKEPSNNSATPVREPGTTLIIDADLTGTCLGDLLQHWFDWAEQANLAHLICGRPEQLPELLATQLPVYVYKPTQEENPQTLVKGLASPQVLYCPSLAETTAAEDNPALPQVQRKVLQAMLGHENAGSFISTVIDRVIDAVCHLHPSLKAVIVDHGPGLSALHWANLSRCNGKERKGIFVTTGDAVDLRAVHELERQLDDKDAFCWVVNRVSGDLDTWRTPISKVHHKDKDWFHYRSSPLFRDEAMASQYAEAGYLAPNSPNQAALDGILKRLFG